MPRVYTIRDRNNGVISGLERVPSDNANLILLMGRGARLPTEDAPVTTFFDVSGSHKTEYRIVLECRCETSKWAVINTWNGGAGGRVLLFTSTQGGSAGHNECFEWIHRNTPFSFSEAVTHQGYKIEPWGGE